MPWGSDISRYVLLAFFVTSSAVYAEPRSPSIDTCLELLRFFSTPRSTLLEKYLSKEMRYEDLFLDELRESAPPLNEAKTRVELALAEENKLRRHENAETWKIGPDSFAGYQLDRGHLSTVLVGSTSSPESHRVFLTGDTLLIATKDLQILRSYSFDPRGRLMRRQSASSFYLKKITEGAPEVGVSRVAGRPLALTISRPSTDLAEKGLNRNSARVPSSMLRRLSDYGALEIRLRGTSGNIQSMTEADFEISLSLDGWKEISRYFK